MPGFCQSFFQSSPLELTRSLSVRSTNSNTVNRLATKLKWFRLVVVEFRQPHEIERCFRSFRSSSGRRTHVSARIIRVVHYFWLLHLFTAKSGSIRSSVTGCVFNHSCWNLDDGLVTRTAAETAAYGSNIPITPPLSINSLKTPVFGLRLYHIWLRFPLLTVRKYCITAHSANFYFRTHTFKLVIHVYI
jgi:hypothetical protein